MTITTFDQATWTLERLLPRLEQRFAHDIATHPDIWATFRERLHRHFPRLFFSTTWKNCLPAWHTPGSNVTPP